MKSKLFFTIAYFIPSLLMAQSGYILSGKITGLKAPAVAYLSIVENGRYVNKDSSVVKRGKFKFKGMVDAPTQAVVALKRSNLSETSSKRDYLPFYLENSAIVIKGRDSILNAEVKGSVAHREQTELEAAIRPLTNTIIKLNNEFRGKPRDEAFQIASDSVTKLVASIKQIRKGFAASHLNSYMGLYTYTTHILDSKFDPDVEEPLYHQFTEELKTSELGQTAWKKIESAKLRQVGVQATDFTQTDIYGKPFQLSSLRGKYVFIDFWASWCAPCRAENPNLVKAYQELKGKDFEVVGVSLDESQKGWEMAVEKDGLPWIHVSDLKGWKNSVAAMYGISAVPQSILIDPQGVVIAKNLRGEELTEKLKALVK